MMLQQAHTAAMALGLALSGMTSCSAFSFSRQSLTKTPLSSAARFSTMLDKTDTEPNTDQDALSEMPTAWECNEEAECAEVPACDEVNCRTSLDVRIHGKWYDLSGK